MTDYWTEFVQESEENITELNNALLALERDPGDEAAMEEIFRIAHTLKGNCGAMGLTRASDLAHAIEDLLDAVRAGGVPVTPELMDVVFDAVDELEGMVDEVAVHEEIRTDPTATIEALRDHLEEATEAPAIRAPTDDEIDATLARFEAPTDDDHDAFLARLSIEPDEEVNNGRLVADALADAFDLIGTEPSREAIENEEYNWTFDAVFGSAVGEAAIAAAFDPIDAVADYEIVSVTDRIERDGGITIGQPDADVDISPDEAEELSVDELLDEFEAFDDLDAMVEDVEDDDDLEAFDDMGEAGSFDDLLDEEDLTEEEEADDEPDDEPDEEADEVDDASAVFAELKEEVEMVEFDELQEELEELEFDEFDEEEVGMDELLGDDFDDDGSFLGDDAADDPDDGGDADASPAADSTAADAGTAVDSSPDLSVDDGAADANEPDPPVDDGAADANEPDPPVDDGAADADEPDPPVDDGAADADEPDPADDDGAADADEPDPPVDETFSFESVATPASGSDDGAATAEPAADDEPDVSSTSAGDDGATDEQAVGTVEEPADAAEADETEASDEPEPAGDGHESTAEVDEAAGDESTDGTDEPDSEVDEGAIEPDEPAGDGVSADAEGVDEPEPTDEGAEPEAGFESDADSGTADAGFDPGADEVAFERGAAADFDDDLDGFDGDADDDFGDADDDFEDSFDDDDLGDLDVEADDDFDVGEFEADAGALGALETAEADAATDDGFGDASGGDAAAERVYEDVPEMEVPDVDVPAIPDEESGDDEDDRPGSIRVDAEQIDSLLNLVEGLVTSRVRLRYAVDSGADYGTLDDELDQLEDITTDLQEAVMDVRLVPLGSVTNRLPRVVRDIARDQGKDVEFDLRGEDVELDRGILDRIGDPLIHLVRNAVDHGIEAPEEREAADKPATGSVAVRAARERGRVTIDVEDDGRGLDPDALREAAVEADVLDEDEADALDDAEAYELIFHPGLSTAEEVTDVSGRGVGMDVVERTIEDLDGSIEIDSEPGEGTTVTMSLPVTVAIDEILFLESGGEEFGVPVKAVRDIGDSTAVERVDGREVFVGDDGEEVPVVDLDEALGTDGGEADVGMVVRIRDDVRPIALRCDEVHDQREVVVKPFEGFMGGIPGLSGATVRGRGEVVTILDVTTL
ncbi:Hpt domain-containing protein [Salinilacihabitans rarus]|uniref:Hpt domain-containing protein n=1 Tax=Salinilacihabitans rarus TaxID=2961596 RepID=UPI0020C86E4C|nr:Hpt domain-containing protein [Salinilacihabitans rarus]